jgi:iron complex outermembrane receptor protein
LDGSNIDATLASTGYMGSGRIMSMMNFKNGFGIQLSGFYRTPMVRVQGTTDAIYSFDLSVQKKILKDKGVISLRLSDIFDTRQWSYYASETNIFELSGTWKRQSRLLIAGFRYSLRQEKRSSRGNRGRSDMRGGDMDF